MVRSSSATGSEKEHRLPGHEIQTASKKASGEELSKRQERAHRILDAASELIQRWGYRKTAVDDIARLAGVAKGTIYLHWKTREDLFVALLLRESVEATRTMIERIDSDSGDFCFSTVVKHSIYVVMTRPLSRALFVQDSGVLGELLQQGRDDLDMLTRQKLTTARQMLNFFRSKGALRADQDLTEQIKIYATMVMGAMTVDQYLPVDMHSSPAEAIERLAAMVHAVLEPAEPIAPEVQRELKAAWDQFIQKLTLILDERLQAIIA